jgi:phage replication-related protein YjqB (UPF0714/DUF867 family)
MLSQDFRELVQLLTENKAEYLIVGGYAVSIHGHPRYTGDLDIWLNPTEKNAALILKSVNEFGFSSFNLQVEDSLLSGRAVDRNSISQHSQSPTSLCIMQLTLY